MSALIFIIAFLLTIMVVVGIHEASHFAAAKLIGVKVLRFSIGFGKVLFSFRDKSGTEYAFALVPLGGYVKMLGEEGEDAANKADIKSTYFAQPLYKKAIIVMAGPLSNFLCAFLLYVIVYSVGFTTLKPVIGNVMPNTIAAKADLKPYEEITSIDKIATPNWTKVIFQLILHTGDEKPLEMTTTKMCGLKENASSLCKAQTTFHHLDLTTWSLAGVNPDPLGSLGIEPYFPKVPLIIGRVSDDSVAAKAGFRLNDQLVKINQTHLHTWQQLIQLIQKIPPDSEIKFLVLRHSKPITITLKLTKTGFFHATPKLGIGPTLIKIPDVLIQKIQYPVFSSFYHAYLQCKDLTYFNLMVLKKMVTGKLSLDNLGGPIAIFDIAGDALKQGLVVFLVFLAFMNLSIGLLNLFPIPGLDGGHLFLQTIEAIIRRPIPPLILEWLMRFGFALLILVFLRAFFNDIFRLFS